jgi:hypothetical protein
MELSDFNEKIMFIKDENLFYYFPLIDYSNNRTIHAVWEKGKLPTRTSGSKSNIINWEEFILKQPKNNLIKYDINDYPKECEIIQINLIKSLFTGWLL